MNISLSDKKALVTGGSRGIGKAVCHGLARAGADMAVLDVLYDQALETAEELKEYGVNAVAVNADVTSADSVNEAVKEAVAALGGLDILVNNAGLTRDSLLMRMKETDWDLVLSVNLKGAFNCTRACIRKILKSRGAIINISSVIGLTGNAGQANYSASKAGLIGFTKSLAHEFGKKGVRANAIAPGFISTEMTDKLSDEIKAAVAEKIPAGLMGKPEDVANLVVFLASEQAAYINGEVIRIDGGLAM